MLGESRQTNILKHLREQLENKRMIYSKDQIELTTTVGQGTVALANYYSHQLCVTIVVYRGDRAGIQGIYQNCNRKRTCCSQNWKRYRKMNLAFLISIFYNSTVFHWGPGNSCKGGVHHVVI